MSFPRLTEQGCRRRASRLWDRLPDRVGSVLVSYPPHVYYFSGFYALPGTLRARSACFLVLKRDGRSTLIVDNWQAEAARNAFVGKIEVVDWYRFRTPPLDREGVALEAVLDLLGKEHAAVGVEPLHLSAYLSSALIDRLHFAELFDVSSDIRALRRHKDEDELAVIRAAVEVGEVGHNAARTAAVQGATELDVWGVVHSACVVQAGEPIEMMGDFASGTERSAQGGGPPTLRVLQNGDLFILDLYPVIHGYRCDLTNTLVVGQEPTAQQRTHLDLIRAAIEAAEKKLRPGVKASQVYQAVWQVFSDAGLSSRFPHHAGHGLGLEHPEAPFLLPESEEVLQAGDVITIEPGLYAKGFGGARLEHEYLITDRGAERLSHHFS